jgi:signal transduction histidine kinase
MFLIAFIMAYSVAFADDNIFEKTTKLCDSLKNELKKPSLTKRQKMMLYEHIASNYASFALDSTIAYGCKGIDIAEELREKEIAHKIYCHVGVAYGLLDNYDTAIFFLNRAYELAVEMQDDNRIISALWLSAYIYANQGKYIVAIDLYIKLLTIFEKYENEHVSLLVAALCNLAELNRKLGNMSITIQYLDRAALHVNKLTDELYIWRISSIYNEYTTVYLLEDNTAKALEYALKSDSVNHGHFIINKCTTKVLLAKIYLRLNEHERALHYAGKAMESANILKNNNLYIDIWKTLSDIYLAQQRYPEAEAEAIKAWNTDSTNINESRAIAANIVLANIYMHNTKKAIYFLKKYSELNKQYSEKSFHTVVSDLSIKYETDKREIQLSSMKWQRLLYISFSIAGFLSATILWIVFRQKVRRERTEKQIIAVSAILEGENKERTRIANDLYKGISKMVLLAKMELNFMEHTQIICDRLDDCLEEIHRIATGMMPSSLTRFGIKAALEEYCCRFPKVQFYFFGDNKRIDEKIEVTVYYCVVELVNNSIKYSDANAINVQLIQEDNRISLTVQDDGRGFNKNAITKGSGLKNINYRVIAFNGTIDIISAPDNGTEINIEFNLSTKP